jgi:hypothetical protein
VLEVEQADLEGMTEASVGLLRQSAGSLMARVVGMRVAIQEDERAVHHLSDGGLLPPTRDVERLLEALRGRVRVWSGWFYIAESESNPRATVQAAPQIALGVVVADEDLDTACAIARQSTIEFEMPVVLAPERALSTDRLAQCVVLGPHSDAWFDRSAGHEELLRREMRLESAGRDIADVEGQHKQIVDVDARLRDFRQTYPRGWFADQEAELNSSTWWVGSWCLLNNMSSATSVRRRRDARSLTNGSGQFWQSRENRRIKSKRRSRWRVNGTPSRRESRVFVISCRKRNCCSRKLNSGAPET